MPPPFRILAVSDHATAWNDIPWLLPSAGQHHTIFVPTGSHLLATLGAAPATTRVVLRPSRMGADALGLCRTIKTRFPHTLVLVVPDSLPESECLRFLDAGVDDVCEGNEEPELLAPVASAAAAPIAASGDPDDRRRRGNARGAVMVHLNRGDLASLLQFLTMTDRIGAIAITPLGAGEAGTVFIEGKTVVGATCGNATGLEAVARLLNCQEAQADFDETRRAPERNIGLPVDHVLIEASVLADESREQAGTTIDEESTTVSCA